MGFFVFLLFLNLSGVSQTRHFDSIRLALNSSPKLIVKLDSKLSFVSNQLVSMRGVKFGVNYNNLVKVGMGYSWMKNNFTFDNPTELINDSLYDLKYSYLSVFGDYKFHAINNWSLLMNTDVAILKLGYKNRKSNKNNFLSYGLVVEPSIIYEYRLFNYFILGGGLGYRFIFREEKQIKEQFSAPIFILRFKIDLPLLYDNHLKKRED